MLFVRHCVLQTAAQAPGQHLPGLMGTGVVVAGGSAGLWPALAEHPSQPLGLALILALLCGPGMISWLRALELSVIAPHPTPVVISCWGLASEEVLVSFWEVILGWHLSHSS